MIFIIDMNFVFNKKTTQAYIKIESESKENLFYNKIPSKNPFGKMHYFNTIYPQIK